MLTRRGLLAGLLALPVVRALAPLVDLLPKPVDPTAVLDLATIDQLKKLAKKVPAPIKPFVIDGQEFYVFVGPDRPFRPISSDEYRIRLLDGGPC